MIGSQSLHGKYPDLADELVASAEADLIAKEPQAPNRVAECNLVRCQIVLRERLIALLAKTPVSGDVRARAGMSS